MAKGKKKKQGEHKVSTLRSCEEIYPFTSYCSRPIW